ncbi:MAG: branched-chain amino acid ABC transporter permease [Streptosporangiales bacterium]|nr:branched-chain amino acid ABC transporter permease [Streptosporangiales bacterium]
MTAEARPVVPEPRWGGRSLTAARAAAVLIALIAAVTVAYATQGQPVVVTQAVITGILTGGVYGLVAMGLTLIFGVLDIVNFAHGAFLALAMFVTFGLVAALGVHPYAALAVSVPLLFALGWVLQYGLLNRAMGGPLQNQLLITLGISLLIENALLLFLGANPRSAPLPGDRALPVLGAVADTSRVLAFAAALALAGALWLILTRTRVGTAIRAVAADPRGAEHVGVDVRRIYALTFALGTACAGAAGTLVAPFATIEPTTGQLFTIVAFVVVVLGGMGNVPGALAGGLVIGLTEQLGGVFLPGQSPMLPVFVVFVLALFLRPQGLFGGNG